MLTREEGSAGPRPAWGSLASPRSAPIAPAAPRVGQPSPRRLEEGCGVEGSPLGRRSSRAGWPGEGGSYGREEARLLPRAFHSALQGAWGTRLGASPVRSRKTAGIHSVLPGPPEPGLTRAWTARRAGASHPAQSLSRHSTGAKPQTSTLGGVPGGPRTTPSPHTSLPHLGDGGAAERLDSSLDPGMSVQDCCNLLTHPCPARAH